MSRRVTILAAAVAAALAGGALPAKEKEAKAGQADRIFVNGRVFTAEPGKPLAEGLAVRGPSLLAVGTSAEMRRHAVKGTEVVDLRGRLVVPGFVDGHLHLPGGSQSLEELRLDDAETFAALTQKVRDWAVAAPRGALGDRRGLDLRGLPGRPAVARPARRRGARPAGLARLVRRPHRLGELARPSASPRSPATPRTRRAGRSCATRGASPPGS